MTLLPNLSEQLIQVLSTLVRFLFTTLFCCHLIENVMILLTVALLLTSISKIFCIKRN